ncbi:MAG: CFI-box-CTERM domain-containing protein [Pseudomonadota bacterium]
MRFVVGLALLVVTIRAGQFIPSPKDGSVVTLQARLQGSFMTKTVFARRRFLAGLVALGALSPAALAQNGQCFIRTAAENANFKIRGFEVGLHPTGVDNVYENVSVLLKPTQMLVSTRIPKDAVSALVKLTVMEFPSGKRFFRIDGQIEQLNEAAYRIPLRSRIVAKFDDADLPGERERKMRGSAFQFTYDDEARFLGTMRGQLEFKVFTEATTSPDTPTMIIRFSPELVNAAWQEAIAKLSSFRQMYADQTCFARPYQPPPRVGAPCFLTTAAVETIGLHDDCWELRTLRRFRDDWLAKQADGPTDIARYYEQAPAVADRLRADPRRLVRLYFTGILPSALAARIGLNHFARRIYSHHMSRLLQAA